MLHHTAIYYTTISSLYILLCKYVSTYIYILLLYCSVYYTHIVYYHVITTRCDQRRSGATRAPLASLRPRGQRWCCIILDTIHNIGCTVNHTVYILYTIYNILYALYSTIYYTIYHILLITQYTISYLRTQYYHIVSHYSICICIHVYVYTCMSVYMYLCI